MKILSVDVGGTHVKVLASDATEPRKFDSGPTMTPGEMVDRVKTLTQDWSYEAVSIGYPGVVRHDGIEAQPHNLGDGWVGFDFHEAFGVPVRLINDAAMQALGIYEGGRMLFLGIGTGLGSAMIVDGAVVPMELAHLPYRKHRTYEEYVGLAGLQRLGKRKWRKHVWAVVGLLRRALEPDYVVIGGGNAKKLRDLPEGVRLGENASAFVGGFRLWEKRSAPSDAPMPPAGLDVLRSSRVR
ncbi:MAG TPA: ROK family protein [Polyangiaceae bacterium]|nr:ROK family protein [Polyangiaceae bacterium]